VYLIGDFAALTQHSGMFDYDEQEYIVCYLCHMAVNAKPDVCLVSESEYHLVEMDEVCIVQRCMSELRHVVRYEPHGSEPRLIADVVPEFYQTNLHRKLVSPS